MSLLCVALVVVLLIAHGLGAAADHHSTSAAGRSGSSTRTLPTGSHRVLGTSVEVFADDSTDVTLRCEDREGQATDPTVVHEDTAEGAGISASATLGQQSEASIGARDWQCSDARVRGPSAPARR